MADSIFKPRTVTPPITVAAFTKPADPLPAAVYEAARREGTSLQDVALNSDRPSRNGILSTRPMVQPAMPFRAR